MADGKEPASNMKARPILQALDIGDDVAEFDERLSSYFIETSSFRDIVADKADLILGAKGSGKSAIFRHLANPEADIPELNDVDIIPASNVQGSVIFRRLSASPPISEPAYRFIWFIFIVAMIANHLLSSYEGILNLDRLAKLIDAADLRVGSPISLRLWEKIEGLISSIARRLEIEGELEFGIPKLPIKARGKGILRSNDAANHPSTEEEVDLEEILLICADNLARLEKRCWIVFDRLDEAFEHSPSLESVVLRGLMRAHLDVASYGSSIRTKLFLRSDIMDRITLRQGFVNATHLRRLNLQWDQEGIIDLLGRRIMSNEAIAEVFGMESEDLKNRSGRLDVCYHIFPSRMYDVSLFTWISLFTTDASQALNPRNVLTLARLARQDQLAVYDRDDPDLASVPSLISADAMMSAFGALSRLRLEDTVYAEFNSLRPVLQALQGKPARLTRQELANYLGAATNSLKFKTTLETLEYAGIVSVNGRSEITVAKLYRRALDMYQERSSGLSLEDEKSLSRRVDSIIEDWPLDDSSLEIQDMSSKERSFIHVYIKKFHPDYFTDSIQIAGLPGVKSLRIQRRAHNAATRTVRLRQRSRESSDNSLTERLERYNPADVALLLGLREQAAEVNEYFISSPLKRSLVSDLVEIDRCLRKNKARRRIVGVLDGPGNDEVQLILGTCDGRIIDPSRDIIDPSREMESVSEELQQGAAEAVNRLCAIADREKRSVNVIFSYPAIGRFAMSLASQHLTINFVDSGSSRTITLQPK